MGVLFKLGGYWMDLHKRPVKNSAVVRQMACSERGRLLKAYAGASAELSGIVAELARSAKSAKSSFDQAWCACEEARSRCEQIQHRIYEHVQGHRCALDIAAGPRAGIPQPRSRASRL